MPKIATASLCNKYSRKQDWFSSCVGTWKQNLCSNIDKFFISDGTLDLEHQKEIEALSGGLFLDISQFAERLAHVFEKYSAISEQRDRCIFYRRIIDFSFYFEDYDYILSLDTDIGLVAPVQLADGLPDFAFCVDEVPGYSASPDIVFKSKIITGLNAGFLLFRPKIILENLDFIEEITQRYISKGKIPWWSEQTLWASIAANLCQNVSVFSHDSVAIVSGSEKRSIHDIRSNKTRYFSPTKKIEDPNHIHRIIGNAKVIHFAGPGKPWIQPVMGKLASELQTLPMQKPHTLKFEPLPPFPPQEKFMLFLRLLVQQFR
ncbi:MAG: hypothetical protein AAFY26_15140 [Cyanobacteria bacterium J06638_22]